MTTTTTEDTMCQTEHQQVSPETMAQAIARRTTQRALHILGCVNASLGSSFAQAIKVANDAKTEVDVLHEGTYDAYRDLKDSGADPKGDELDIAAADLDDARSALNSVRSTLLSHIGVLEAAQRDEARIEESLNRMHAS